MRSSRWLAAVAVVVALACVVSWRCHGVRGTANQPTTRAATGQRATKTFAKTASIRGVVTDEKRAPVTSAIVCADGNSETLQAELIHAPRCTHTDSRGAYELRELYAAEYAVAAVIAPYRPERAKPFLLADGEQKSGVDLQLRLKGVEVTGVVVDITGGPIARARVRQATEPEVETDAQGRFTLWTRPGRIDLSASADGYVEGPRYRTYPPRSFAPGNYEIVLTPEGSMSGTVIDVRTGKPVANATVETESESEVTDDDGRFRFAHLRPGRYALMAYADAGYGLSNGSVLVGMAQQVDGVVVELHPAYRASGRVVQPDGKPCLAAELSFERDDHTFVAHRDPDGTLRIGGLLPGTYEVSTDCPGFATPNDNAPVVVVDRDVTNVTWSVSVAAELSGRVTTRSGAPVEGAEVSILGGPDEMTDSDGTYRVSGITPGELEIYIFTSEGIPPLDGYKLELGAGQKMKRDFVLDPPGGIRGVVTGPEGAPLSGIEMDVIRKPVDYDTRGSSVVRTDEKGAFEVGGLPPGIYKVRYASGLTGDSSAEPSAIVEVRAGMMATVQLAITKHSGTITGRVVDAAGKPVADAFVGAVHEMANKELATSLVRSDRDLRRVVTGIDGSFVLKNIGPGTYLVHAARKGGAEVLVKSVVAGGSTLLQLPVTTAAIEGLVTVAGRAPSGEVSIYLSSNGEARREQFFGTGGRFAIGDLPPGDYGVTVDVGRSQKEIKITLAAGERKHDVAIGFAGEVTLTGRLVDRGGAPVAKLTVRVSSAEQPNSSDGESGTDGRWTIANVPRGEIDLFAFDFDRGIDVHGRYSVNGNGVVDLGDIVAVPSK